MPKRLFLDNWTAFLEAPVSAAATALSVGAALASRFTGLGSGDFYPVTLSRIETVDGQLRETAWEVVHVTAKAGGVLTVLRAQEGTAALAWLQGDMVSVRLTRAALTEIYARLAAVEAAIPPAPTVSVFNLGLLVKGSIFGSLGWESTGENTGASVTPSGLAFGGDIGTVPLRGIFIQPGIDDAPGSFYLKIAREFTGAQLVSIAVQGIGTFSGAGAEFFEASGGLSTWTWPMPPHNWADGVTRALTLTFEL
ncbi:hypothetical protein OU997_05205 [Pseudomonas sp. SL4(2022)]|uniref:hypothetical protein n=1 Tax=Pseudomonas sp. SL4(2022) TaxID=2994661 RepID=UPI00226E9C2F|nr:hypothetical protein [Pseudomonas sp. SL4(2022)]WAC45570.1 hypothetical protein OU997_05205 [Pseudomonas sp. SL4(2022)]